MNAVIPGAEVFVNNAETRLKGKRWAILTNQSAVLSNYTYTINALKMKGFSPQFIFAPEHGVFGVEQDQIDVRTEQETLFSAPAISLYGQTAQELYPDTKDMEQADILLVDIQDIGTRYYTFIYTMAFCIEKCAQLNIPVIICDRPNPINGVTIEGPGIERGYESFVGAYDLPIRHSLTIAEIALYLNTKNKVKANIQVIPMPNWSRDSYLTDYVYPWVSPSPNMVSCETALVYPGTCLLEGTNISEGRGTTRPFEIFGAPFLDANTLCAELNNLRLAGVIFRPVKFRPVFHKFANELCQGAFLHVTDKATFMPYKTGIEILQILAEQSDKHFSWRTQPYEYIDDKPAIDILTGSNYIRKQLGHRNRINAYHEQCKEKARAFSGHFKEYKIY